MDAYIVDWRRSPFHFAKKGALVDVRPDELAAQVVKGLLAAQDLDPALLEDVILGCAYPEAEQGTNLARIVSFVAGLPNTVAAQTVNRFCGSSMNAIHMAAGAIAAGAGEAFLCVGVESMSRVPQGGFNPSPNPELSANCPQAYTPMGITAENLADGYAISRREQEEFAVRSHQKAARAVQAGNYREEIIRIRLPGGEVIDSDGCVRADTSAEKMGGLKPAFRRDGTVTAATSSPLTDGATAVLVTSERFIAAQRLTPLAQLKSIAVAGCAPELMGIGPVPATLKALARAGLGLDELDLVEMNEAFAAQAMACIRELGIGEERLNLDGGALALGHPLGATGARITGKAASLLRRNGARYALATQCIGGGQGIATVLQAV